MHLSYILTTLMSFIVIAAAYPTPGPISNSLAVREELARYVNTSYRAPDDPPSPPQLDDPDKIDEPNWHD
ncbi:hypothetical protein CY34DRAFT_811631 [Suillus luteus UH-Slu-Lm8-n1]|uniref:Uncharacterized protein n=1 Tax=Suillus luteus UH-Slu-Lm8-n1 TaxID=930992 RepID=A0A0C9ZF10_9AGAM|nr:hypothetical protein CY34DRAFT_811631 [Suillus luteus UH-Slu-Lm8-n1]